jgi:hypothetical protein
MPKAGEKNNAPRRSTTKPGDTAPDDFPEELLGEFGKLSDQLTSNIGVIAAMSVSGGGYFGISVTDDAGSVRLAIRCKAFELDRRFYGIAKLEAALAYCLRKLREAV